MSDREFRIAQRHWQNIGTYETWVHYLQIARRTGNPIFTEEHLGGTLRAVCDWRSSDKPYSTPHPHKIEFNDTDDGFIAHVAHAFNPLIERTYRLAVPGGYDQENFQIWDRWSGTIIVCWATDFIPPCPGLEIKVSSYQQADGGYYIERNEGEELEFIYEGNCVSSAKELEQAMCDFNDWIEP